MQLGYKGSNRELVNHNSVEMGKNLKWPQNASAEEICDIPVIFAALQEIPTIKYTRPSTLKISNKETPDLKIRTRLNALQLKLKAALITVHRDLITCPWTMSLYRCIT